MCGCVCVCACACACVCVCVCVCVWVCVCACACVCVCVCVCVHILLTINHVLQYNANLMLFFEMLNDEVKYVNMSIISLYIYILYIYMEQALATTTIKCSSYPLFGFVCL